MPYSVAGKNLMLNALRGTAPATPLTHASLHSAIPDDTGSSEIAGGSPAYARKAATFNAAASGAIVKDATDPVFDVPASTTVVAVGFWSAVTAGTFLGWAPINGGSVDGVATVADTGDLFTSYAHGLADDNRVYVQAVTGQALPGGLSATVLYFVISSTANTFQVSLTQGGAAVAITSDQECYFQKIVPEVFGSQGTLTLDTATLDLNG
jgi:hypothetical protein